MIKWTLFLILFAVCGFSETQQTSSIQLKQILLVKDGSEIETKSASAVSVHEDLNLPSGPFEEALSDFIGNDLDMDLISKVEGAILDIYRNADRPFVLVAAQEQDVSDGTLVMKVMEGEVGEVRVLCNEYFSDCLLLGWSNLCKGDCLDRQDVYDELSWMNRNPYRIVDAVFAAGKEQGTTDIEYVVQDRLPLRIYAGVDNTGNDFTGNNRLFAGLNWGNVFGSDQIFSYQYTTDDRFKRVQAHTGYYQIPLPWKNMLTFYGGYSYIKTDFDLPNVNQNRFRNDGYSGQLSMRYDIPLPTYRNFQHELTFGTDWKTMNNAVLFNEISINPRKVNLFQLMFAYNLGYEIKGFRLIFEAEGFGNPGDWLPHQSNADYASIRTFAKNAYFYARGLIKVLWNFVDPVYFSLQIRGQGATTNLLPSEQLGVGGYASVRGYKERELNADNGLLINAEIQSAPISLVRRFRNKCDWIDQFQLLFFFDYGLSNVHQPVPLEEKTQSIYSLGPGARYYINPYLTLQADWGFQLHHIPGTGPHDRLNFYASLAY